MKRFSCGILATLLLLPLTSAATRAQSTATGVSRGSVEGSVVDSVTGLPIEGVYLALVSGQSLPETGFQPLLANQKPTSEVPQVTKIIPGLVLNGRTLQPDRSAHFVLTDVGGKFSFDGLAAATYALSLRADGYNFQVYGQKPDSLGALPIEVQDGKLNIGVIRMNPESRLIGTITGGDSQPIAMVPVYLLKAAPSINVDGQREYRVLAETMTDAAGGYVLEKISPGRYFIAAGSFGGQQIFAFPTAPAPDGGRTTIRQPATRPFPFSYYPGVSDVGQAVQITVPAGAKLEVGTMILTKGELRAIRGHAVDNTTGKPPEKVNIVLNGQFPFQRDGRYRAEMLGQISGAYNRSTGIFEFTNLIPGRYRIDASLPITQSSTTQRDFADFATLAGGPSSQSAFQILELTDSDVENVVLTVPANGRVAGRVVVTEGKPLPFAESNLPIPLQLMFQPIAPLQPTPLVTAVSTVDGSFKVGIGLAGRYRFSIVPLRDNYYVSEARLDGERVVNGILDISQNTVSELILTLSPGGQFQGTVVDQKGQPAKQAQGIVLPDPLPEVIPFYRTVQSDASGRFIAAGVPPGNYRVYVWENVEPSQFFDRELLTRSRRFAFPIQVDKGSNISGSVPLIVQ